MLNLKKEDIKKLQGYSASAGTFTEENSEAVDEILQRYSNMVDDKIDYHAKWIDLMAQGIQSRPGMY